MVKAAKSHHRYVLRTIRSTEIPHMCSQEPLSKPDNYLYLLRSVYVTVQVKGPPDVIMTLLSSLVGCFMLYPF